MKVLIIEDSEEMGRSIRLCLSKEGHEVKLIADGLKGRTEACKGEHDVLILDLGLPKLDGLEILRSVREMGLTTRILILSARTSVRERVEGLRLGADDYLTKPFAFDELIARVETLGRRSDFGASKQLQLGRLTLDAGQKEVLVDGAPVEMAPREFSMLLLLAKRSGTLVSRMEIENYLYGASMHPESNAVDASICLLRGVLEKAGLKDMIRTKRGSGYLLQVDEQ
jgi:DNA-binding response OmpR family regulator